MSLFRAQHLSLTCLLWTLLALLPHRSVGQGHVLRIDVSSQGTVSAPSGGADKVEPPFSATFLEDRDHIAVLEIEGNYDQRSGGDFNSLPRQLVAQEYYRHHPDDYDFLFIFSTFEYDTGTAQAFYVGVQNPVQGIGQELFDLSASMGSDGRLLGMVEMAALGRYDLTTNSPSFEGALVTMGHELMHQWCCYSDALEGALLGRDGFHWSYLLDSDASVMYGSDWRDNGDGTWRAVAAERFYSPLDLYLAGYYGDDEVPPFDLLQNPAIDPTQLPNPGDEIAATASRLGVDSLIAAHGPRLPSGAEDRPLRAAFLLLTRPQEAVQAAQLRGIDRLRRQFADRFAVLTGGRGLLHVLPSEVPGQGGQPSGTDGGDVRPPEQVDLGAALAWLRGRQTTEGFWQDRPGSRLRDTTVALQLLATRDPDFSGQQAAGDWLVAQREMATDYLARHSLALDGLGIDAASQRAELLARQRNDGGWGLHGQHHSDALDTALALDALAGYGELSSTGLEAGVQFLVSAQGDDGGWGPVPGAPGRTGTTTAVLRVLQRLQRLTEVEDAATAFLAARQNAADGGFGDSPSTSHDTASVLEILRHLGRRQAIDETSAETYLRQRQGLDGSWDGGVYATARVVVALGGPRQADLSIDSVLAVPASPHEGQAVQLTVRLLNGGVEDAPAFDLSLFEEQAGQEITVASQTVQGLAAGQSVDLVVPWDSTDRAGSRSLLLRVDAQNAVVENDEANNTYSLLLEVQEAPPGIDLAIADDDILTTPATPGILPSEVAFSALVRNLGRSDAADVEVRLWAGDGVDDTLDGELLAIRSFPLLANRSSLVANFVYPLANATPPIFTFQVTSPVGEDDLANNQAALSLDLAPSVDLALGDDSLSLSPDPALLGSLATFRAEIHNYGTLDAPPAEVVFRLDDGTNSQELDRRSLTLGAGQTTVETVTWNVNQVGEMTFSAHLDEDGRVPESDESNNLASFVFQSTDDTLPDLSLTLIDPPAERIDGQRLQLRVALRNLGGLLAPAHQLSLFAGDPTAGMILASTEVPALFPGQSLEVSLVWDTFGQTGSHLLSVLADSQGTVAELDESNNRADFELLVTGPPSEAEIDVASQGLVINPDQVLALPADLELQARVRNLGLVSAEGLTLRWWLGEASNGTLLSEQSLADLPPRDELTVSLSHQLTTPGRNDFTVEVLTTSAGDDAADNLATASVRTVEGIDLRFAEPALSLEPAAAVLGYDVRFTAAIQNYGTVDSDTFQVRFLLDDGNERREIRTLALAVEAGTTAHPSFLWRTDRLGASTLEVELDTGDLIPERHEDNNLASLPFTVLDDTEPDLALDIAPLLFAPEPALEGSGNTLSTTLHNLGGGEAFDVLVTFYDGNPADGGVEIDSLTVPVVAAGASLPISVQWTNVPDPANRQIYVLADPLDAIPEPNEANNLTLRSLEVLSLPDLAVSPLSLAVEPPFPVPGDSVTLTVTTTNLGEQDTDPFSVQVFLGDPALGGQPLAAAQLSLNGLADGQTVFSFQLPSDLESATLVARVDADGQVIESREDNNQVELALAFQNRDFFVSQRYFSPDGDGIQDSSRFFFQLATPHDVQVQVKAPKGEIVRRHSTPQWASTLGGNFQWDGLDDLGRVVDDGVYTLQLIDVDGTVLGQAVVETDTNRSRLIYAAGNEFSRYTNLTCNVRNAVLRFSPDEATVYLAVEAGSANLEPGVYRMRPDTSALLTLATWGDFDDHYPIALEVAPAGDLLAVEVERVVGSGVISHKIFVLSPDGLIFEELLADGRLVGFSAAGEVIAATTGQPVEIFAIEPTTGDRRSLLTLSEQSGLFGADLAPDRSHLLVRNSSERWLVGIEGGAPRLLPPQALCETQWSGDSSLVVISCAGSHGADVFNTDGELLINLPVPIEAYPQDILPPGLDVYPPPNWLAYPGEAIPLVSWSEDDRELLMEVVYYDDSFRCGTGSYKALVHGDLATGTTTVVARSLPQLPPLDCGGEFLVDPQAPQKAHDGTTEPHLAVLPDLQHVRWWIPDAGLALTAGYGVTLDEACLEGGPCQLDHLFDEFEDFRAEEFLPSGLAMLFTSTDATRDPESSCFGPATDHTDTWTLRSLLNLTVELKVEYDEEGDLELRGTAADLNLDRYFMEWTETPSDPTSWQLMAPPSGDPVVDDILVSWIPPRPGLFTVRLTVVDLAGNRRQEVEQVSSTQTPTLVNLFADPSIFSVSGSSPIDRAEIFYDVLQPVVLSFQILDARDRPVRTLVRSHGDAAVGQSLVWDGRDEQGQPVADGTYRVVVLGSDLNLVVDSTPPVVAARFHARTSQPGSCHEVARLGDYRFSGSIFDPERRSLMPRAAFQRGRLDDDRWWQDLSYQINFYPELAPFLWVPVRDPLTDIHSPLEVVEQQLVYRTVATDRAGNSASQVAPPERHLVLEAVGVHRAQGDGFEELPPQPSLGSTSANDRAYPRHLFASSELRLRLAESVSDPLLQVFVDSRSLEGDGGVQPWQSTAVSQFLIPGSSDFIALPTDHASEFLWSGFGQPKAQQIELRVRAVDGAGGQWLSNPSVVIFEPVELMGQVTDEDLTAQSPWGAELLNLLNHPDIDLGTQVVVWGLQNLPYWNDRTVLEVQSDDDARYAEAQRFEVTAVSGGVFVVGLQDLRQDADYRFTAIVLQGTCLGEQVSYRPDRTPDEDEAELRLAVERKLAEAGCGDYAASAELEISAAASSLAELQRLEVLAVDGQGAESLLFSQQAPIPGTTHWPTPLAFPLATDVRYRVRLSGSHRLTGVTLTPVVDEVLFAAAGDPPQPVIDQPLADELVCLGGPLTLPVLGVVPVDGDFTDRTSLRWTDPLGNPRDELIEGGADPLRPFQQQLLGIYDGRGPLGGGEATVQLKVGDDRGRFTCVETPVVIDNTLEPTGLAAQDPVFSPNGDGTLDTTLLSYFSSEPTTLTMTIQGSDSTTSNPVLRTLVQNVSVIGQGTLPWNGTAEDGQVLPDGAYTVSALLRDACGHTRQHSTVVKIDTTPPTVAISEPTLAVAAASTVQVLGEVDDPNLTSYSLEVMTDDSEWVHLQTGIHGVHGTTLGSWLVLDGNLATLRLTARDRGGNVNQTEQQVSIEVQGELITFVEAAPTLFSPNGDGRLERTALRFSLSQAAAVFLTIENVDGQRLDILLGEQIFEAGSHVVPWDGTVGEVGNVLADGRYTLKLLASLQNPTFEQEAEVFVELDKTVPFTALISPAVDGWARGNESLTGTVSDLHLLGYQLTLRNLDDNSTTVLASGNAERQEEILAILDLSSDGTYELTLAANDLGESESDSRRTLQVDTTPPAVRLISPAEGALVGAGGGPVIIQGTVDEDHLANYRLDAVPVSAPGATRPVAFFEQLPVDGNLASWDLSGVPDGTYQLRLTAQDLAGWQSETTVLVEVDSTPPTVGLSSPEADQFVSAPLPILGRVTDPHLDHFTLALSPVGQQQFTEIHRQSDEVDGGVLSQWQLLPPDGAYLLRLEAIDLLGNRSQLAVPVRIDVTPPATPLDLSAELVGTNAARLQWHPVSDPDLVGYRLLRGALQVGPPLITASQWLEEGLPTGTHLYTVRAVDQASLESEPSNGAQVVVDLDAPITQLQSPQDGGRVGGIVEVVGTAFSADDFKQYRLSVAAGDSDDFVELRRSPVPVQLDTIGQWSTLGLAEESTHTLRLESEDIHGNLSAVAARVTVDNRPPAAPAALAATVSLDDVQLSWQANTETDLLGYLLYRNGQLANADGSTGGSLRPYVIPPNGVPGGLQTYLDAHRPDGTYIYHLQAIDQAENVSPPSSPLEVVVETGPPRAMISRPTANHRFDQPLYVRASVVDHDVATVQLQVRPEGAGAWTDLAPLDDSAPWDTTWQLDGVAYGTYELRAVATDHSNLMDPAPPSIQVTHQDVTPPTAVAELRLEAIDGGSVDLSWAANTTDGDLAGYHVERRDVEGAVVRLTSTALSATAFRDAAAPDGLLTYTVLAIDGADNLSPPSNEAQGRVFTPFLEPIPSPTPQNHIDLVGSVPPSVAPVEVSIDWQDAAGNRTLPALSSDEDGAFRLDGLDLLAGNNTFTVVATDPSGHRSRATSLEIEVIARPAPPVWVGSVTTGNEVDLSWQANAEPFVVGYFLHRDGQRLGSVPAIGLSSATASSSQSGFPASYALEPPTEAGARNWLSAASAAPVTGQWLEVTWSTPRPVAEVEVQWANSVRDFDLEVWQDGAWIKVGEQRNKSVFRSRVICDLEIVSQRLRIVFRSAETQAGIYYIEVFESPLITTATYHDGPLNGVFTYTLEALADSGFVSDPSLPLTILVGDGPPQPVVLSGSVDGSTVNLSWSASPSEDADRYEIYRDGAIIGELFTDEEQTFSDTNRPNGTYVYQVLTFDLQNQSSPSNSVAFTVAVEPPPAPLIVSLEQGDNDRSLVLTWQPGSGLPTSRYLVWRSTFPGGPYDLLGNTTALSAVDGNVLVDQTYYYVVQGLDDGGNSGPYSEEISGALDVVSTLPTPELIAPRLDSGDPFTTLNASTTLEGTIDSASLGLKVHVLRDGVEVGSTYPQQRLVGEASASSLDPVGAGLIRTTGDGTRTALLGAESGAVAVYEWASGDEQVITDLSGEPRWFHDHRRLLFANDGQITSHDVVDGGRTLLAQTDAARLAVPSPDGQLLAVVGVQAGVEGLWTVDPGNGSWRLLVAEAVGNFSTYGVQWSPDGQWLVFRLDSPRSLELFHLDTGERRLVEDASYTAEPSWSPDSSEIVYISQYFSSIRAVYRYQLATQQKIRVYYTSSRPAMPQYSPDGQSIGYWKRQVSSIPPSDQLYVMDLDGSPNRFVFDGNLVSGNVASWDWIGDQYFVKFRDGDGRLAANRLRTTGSFFYSVPLLIGDNTLTAFGDDLIGRVSELSEPLVVQRLSNRPDLRVGLDDVRLLPTVPRVGETSRLAVTVHSVGDVAAGDSALRVELNPPQGSPILLADSLPLSPLEVGGSTTLLYDVLPTQEGFYTVEVIADVEDDLLEADETNNRTVANFQVVASSQPVLQLATPRHFYGAHEEVALALEVFNPGDTFDGQVILWVEDGDGFIVEELMPLPVAALPFAGTWTGSSSWTTGQVFAGPYRLRASLLDSEEHILVEAAAEITVVATGSLEAELSSDRSLYLRGETVRLDAAVRISGGNESIDDAVATLRLSDAGGFEVASWAQDLGPMLPGSEVTIHRQWSSAGAFEGIYDVQLTVERGSDSAGIPAAGAATTFEVAATITAPLLVAEKTVIVSLDQDGSGNASPGDRLRYEIVVSNRGNAMAQELVVLDELAAVLTLLPESITTGAGVLRSTEPLVVDIAALEAGASTSIAFEAQVADQLPDGSVEVVNQAVIDAVGIEALLSDDPSTFEPDDATRLAIVAMPELRFSKDDSLHEDRDGDGVASPGDRLRYSLTVQNVGTTSAHQLLLEDVLPAHTTLVADGVVTSGQIEELTAGFVAVSLPQLAPQESFDLLLTVEIAPTLPGGLVELSNQALLSSLELPVQLSHDPDRPGTEQPTRTPLVASPVLVLHKTVSVDGGADSAEAGSLLTYRLEAFNQGSQAATGLRLADVLPSHTVLLPESIALSAGGLDSQEPLVASLGELAAGGSWQLTFQARVVDPLPPTADRIVNQGSLSSFELPTVLSDDPATADGPDATVLLLGGDPGQTTACDVETFSDPDLSDWQVAYLGDASAGGAAVVDDRLQLSGNGSSLYHGPDSGFFLYRPLGTDENLRLEVDVTGFPVDTGGAARKVALMLRAHLGAEAPRVMVTYVPHFPDPPTSAVQFDVRAFVGDSPRELANSVFDVPLPARLAIEKRGDRYAVLYSVDGGASWQSPGGAGFDGSIEIDLGDQPLAGLVATSYDDAALITAELDHFAVCRPADGGATVPPPLTPCDATQPVDMVLLLDLSGSMISPYGHGTGTTTRLQAAQGAITSLLDGLAQAADGSRAALLTFAGFRTPAENLAAGVQVQSGFSDDLGAVAELAASFVAADIDPGTTTPTPLALAASLELLLQAGDPDHQPAVVLITDGIPNIDLQGRGPDAYELEELQAISLDDTQGRYHRWPAVAWMGHFNPTLGTFDGEPLANSMFQIERLKLTLPKVLIYGVGLQGDGVGLGAFNQDLLDYAAYFSGARSFAAGDTTGLADAIAVLATDLDCGGIGSAAIGDRVWHDLDGNGAQDLDEPGLNGVSLDLFDSFGFGVTRVTTEGDGEYLIDTLPAGEYSLRVRPESLPPLVDLPTWDLDGLGSIDTAELSLGEGETRLDADFGYEERPTSPATTLCADDTFDDLSPQAWQLAELGDAQDAAVAVEDGALWLSGDGSSLYHGDDSGAFLYQPVTGDLRLEVDVTGFPVDQGGAVRKACLMMRADLEPRAARVMACFIPHLPGPNPGDPETAALQFDVRHADGSAEELAGLVQQVALPVRLAIERRGDVFTVFYSRDGGVHWLRPVAQLGGQAQVAMGPGPLAGLAVASYDPTQATTAAFDHWSQCRPNGEPPFEPPPSIACTPQAPLDVVYLLDLSSSMTSPMDDGTGGQTSRLEAARQGLLQLHGGLAQTPGLRSALLAFRGHDTAAANLSDNTQVLSPLGAGDAALEAQLLALDVTAIAPDTETPTALALRSTLQMLLSQSQGVRPAVVLLSDGVPNIDGRGLGPYDLRAVGGVSLRDPAGDFLSWSQVAWRGDFEPQLGTFAGEPLAHAMAALEELRLSLPELRIYALSLLGGDDGTDLTTSHRDLADYAAFVSQGLAFPVDDLTALQLAIDDIGQALSCEVSP